MPAGAGEHGGPVTATAARDTAAAAASRARVVVRDLHDHPEMGAVSDLFDGVWGRAEGAAALLGSELLTALAHAGAQVSGAYRDRALVGATAAFLGRDDAGLFLHSHITGVLPSAAGHGVGRALKWHQRAWCLERGLTRVRWTFDPLVRRNATFNLVTLGARVVAFVGDVYGAVDDARNAGLPTDRLVAEWDLTAPRVAAAAAGRPAEPDIPALRRAGAMTVLDRGDGEQPEVTTPRGERLLARVPADIEGLRRARPDLAASWGTAVRETVAAALDAGYHVTGFGREGWYVLARERAVRDLAPAP